MNAVCIPFPRKGTEKVPLIGIGLLGKDELKASYKANGGKTTIQYKRRRTAYSSTSLHKKFPISNTPKTTQMPKITYMDG